MKQRLAAFLFSTLLSACTFAVNAPARLLGDYTVTHDIPYGEHGQQLDVYMPEKTDGPVPMVIYFYGGGWNAGSKDMYPFVGDAFTSRGYGVVIPDYRKYPDVRFPAFMEDGAQAVRWTREHIGEMDGDPANISIVGHSAGAHLGALLISDPQYLQAEGLQPSAIQAFVGLAGPYHFIPEKELYKNVFGPPERYPQMHVDNFIDGSEPAMFLLAGGEDDTVNISNLHHLQNAIERHNGKVQSKIYPGMSHIEIAAVLSRPLRHRAAVLNDAVAFLREH